MNPSVRVEETTFETRFISIGTWPAPRKELIFEDEVVERIRVGSRVESRTVRQRRRHVDDELPAVAEKFRAFVEGGRQGP